MRRVTFPILLGLVGCAILIWLGVWQTQRLAWKEAMLARIEARIYDAPQPVPVAPDAARDEYQPVQVQGDIRAGEVLVLKGVTGQSPKYRLIVPLQVDDRRIMADLGAIPEVDKDAARAQGPVTITGNLHWPDELSNWTPAPTDGIWYARDVPAMAEALQTEPVLIVARSHDRPDLNADPIPVSTANIPNDHLGYAITWFGLAAVWALMSLILIRRTLRSDP